MADLPSSQQRDVIKQLSPPWLAEGTNEKYMYNLGLACDALLEKMNQAMRAHMPGLCHFSALPYLGRDRVLAQGPFESNDNFTTRLTQAFDTWQRAGSRRAVMSQVLNYISGYIVEDTDQVPHSVTVSCSSAGTWATWDTYFSTSDLSQPPSHISITPANWDWDGFYLWWRAWLILFIDATSDLEPEDTWGNGDWGDEDGSWGFNIESTFFDPVRNLVRLWKSANTYYPWLIFVFGTNDGGIGEDLSPNSSAGSGNPDGTWGNWGVLVDGVYVQSRPSHMRFVDGTGIYQSCSIHTGT